MQQSSLYNARDWKIIQISCDLDTHQCDQIWQSLKVLGNFLGFIKQVFGKTFNLHFAIGKVSLLYLDGHILDK